MGSLWGLALSLFFCCWEAGAPGSSAGPSTHGPSPLVTVNHTEKPAVTLGVNTSLEEASQTTDLAETSVPSHIPLGTQTLDTQTSARTLIPASTISEAKTRKTKIIFPATKTKALTKITPSKFMIMITSPVETSATGDSFSGVGMSTAETITGSGLSVAVFDILCTDDSSEEEKRITVDALTVAHSSAEARALASESSSVPDITTSSALAPDLAVPPTALVAYTVTNIEVTDCSITEIEATAIIPEISDIDHSPTGGKTLSTPETSALPDFTGAKSHHTGTMTSSEILSTASTTESVSPDTTVETSHITSSTSEGETTAAKATPPCRTLETVSMNPLEETSTPSAETASHSIVSGAVTSSTEAGPTMGKATSSAGSSGRVYSLSEVATIKKSTHSETSTKDSTTSGPVLLGKSPLPSVHLTTANSSRETHITLAKTTASVKTSKTASRAGGKPPTATPTTVWTKQTTEVTTGGDEGFLLLRLSVASPEDLTDPRVAERLMHLLRHELHAYTPPSQVSLLRVRRG
ncbi:mucin-20 [Saccopteryx leptura]|uniref:mucin-20 n=1 Tax=Saccopteryx leptura TaxID=249018 RepID=UPI00339C4291